MDLGQLEATTRELIRTGHQAEARDIITRYIQVQGSSDRLYYLLGNTYSKEHNWQEAIKCYNMALETNPESPARDALEMINNILDYYCHDMYNP